MASIRHRNDPRNASFVGRPMMRPIERHRIVRRSRRTTLEQATTIHQLKAHGLLQRQIADIVGVSQSTVCRVLQGRILPIAATLA